MTGSAKFNPNQIATMISRIRMNYFPNRAAK